MSTPAEPSTKAYRTSDTPFAAYLHYSGLRLVTTVQDPNDYKREVVVFVHEDTIPGLQKDWQLGKAVGELKSYHRSLKIVNRFINEARNKRED